MAKIHALEPQKNPCYKQKANKKTQANGIQSNKQKKNSLKTKMLPHKLIVQLRSSLCYSHFNRPRVAWAVLQPI